MGSESKRLITLASLLGVLIEAVPQVTRGSPLSPCRAPADTQGQYGNPKASVQGISISELFWSEEREDLGMMVTAEYEYE